MSEIHCAQNCNKCIKFHCQAVNYRSLSGLSTHCWAILFWYPAVNYVCVAICVLLIKKPKEQILGWQHPSYSRACWTVWVRFFFSQKQTLLSGIGSSSLGCRRWFWDTNVSALLLTHFTTFGSCFSSLSRKCCSEIAVKQKYPCVHGLPACTTASHSSL